MLKLSLICAVLLLSSIALLAPRLPGGKNSDLTTAGAGQGLEMAALRAPAVYITHGGGPYPVIGGPGHAPLTAFLKSWPKTLQAPPKALLVVSGHWEEPVATVTTAAQPSLLFDYGGFPPEAYALKYPAPGSPALAGRVAAALQAAGIECRKDGTRGFDHGTFIPLMLMFPEAAIPVVTLSLLSSLDPMAHIRMGEALAPLRDEGVAIIGSGSSFHNMGGLFAAMGDPRSGAGAQAVERSKRFDEWLQHVTTHPSLSYEQRVEQLAAWRRAPEAAFAHPREEHLAPLWVALGAGKGDAGKLAFSGLAMNVHVSSMQWG